MAAGWQCRRADIDRVSVPVRRRLRELAAQDGRGELGQVRAGEVGREV